MKKGHFALMKLCAGACFLSIASLGAVYYDSTPLKLTVSLISSDGKTNNLMAATIKLRNPSGFPTGSLFGSNAGVYITRSTIPPDAVEIKKGLVFWEEIGRITWSGGAKDLNLPYAQATLIYLDGKEREGFLWKPEKGHFNSLKPSDLVIVGKMIMGDKLEDVEIKEDRLTTLIFNSVAADRSRNGTRRATE